MPLLNHHVTNLFPINCVYFSSFSLPLFQILKCFAVIKFKIKIFSDETIKCLICFVYSIVNAGLWHLQIIVFCFITQHPNLFAIRAAFLQLYATPVLLSYEFINFKWHPCPFNTTDSMKTHTIGNAKHTAGRIEADSTPLSNSNHHIPQN